MAAKRRSKRRAWTGTMRIKALPEDARLITPSDDTEYADLESGLRLYVDRFGTVYAERTETVYYRVLQGRDHA